MAVWNWLDWVLIGIVIASTAAAAVKGFMRELISLATLVAALVIAALGYASAAAWFEDLTKSHTVALGAGFLALFLGTMLVGAAVSVATKKLIQTAGLQTFDRFLGGAFGLVRGLLIDCVLLMAMLSFAIKTEVVQQSVLAPFVSAGARVIVLVMPKGLKDQFAQGFGRFHQVMTEQDKKATQN